MSDASGGGKRLHVDESSKALLGQSETLDMIYSRLGAYAPRKRLLHVDYKEKGRDMNRSHVLYQPPGVSDGEIVASLMGTYKERGCTVSAIIEVDDSLRMIGVHYVRPGFLEECRQDMMKMSQGCDR